MSMYKIKLRIRNLIRKIFGYKTPFESKIYNLDGSKSQYGQETFVNYIINKKDCGYYVDVGASNGILCSNTLILEQNGWNGICIEPIPTQYKKLIKNRPNSINVNLSISDSTNNFKFVEFLDDRSEYSGQLNTIRDEKLLDKFKHKIVEVKVETLNNLLIENNAPNFIDYIDIDVEGHELNVLQSIDYSKFSFNIIGVETNPRLENFYKIKKFLENKGYSLIAQLGSDAMFVKNNKT